MHLITHIVATQISSFNKLVSQSWQNRQGKHYEKIYFHLQIINLFKATLPMFHGCQSSWCIQGCWGFFFFFWYSQGIHFIKLLLNSTGTLADSLNGILVLSRTLNSSRNSRIESSCSRSNIQCIEKEIQNWQLVKRQYWLYVLIITYFYLCQ